MYLLQEEIEGVLKLQYFLYFVSKLCMLSILAIDVGKQNKTSLLDTSSRATLLNFAFIVKDSIGFRVCLSSRVDSNDEIQYVIASSLRVFAL